MREIRQSGLAGGALTRPYPIRNAELRTRNAKPICYCNAEAVA